jgi:hypothetical protein
MEQEFSHVNTSTYRQGSRLTNILFRQVGTYSNSYYMNAVFAHCLSFTHLYLMFYVPLSIPHFYCFLECGSPLDQDDYQQQNDIQAVIRLPDASNWFWNIRELSHLS